MVFVLTPRMFAASRMVYSIFRFLGTVVCVDSIIFGCPFHKKQVRD
jgi:coenzyme F420-reducing hydrogenase gamma subunit